MAIIAMPDHRFHTVQWSLTQPAQVNRSEWTGRRQVMQLPGAATWAVSAEHIPIFGEDGTRPWRAFLARMRGPVNKTRFYATGLAQRAGVNPAVTSGAAGSFAIGLSGLPLNATVLPAGAFVTLIYAGGDEQLLQLAAPLTSNGSGVGSAATEPMLRRSAVGATIETIRPWCLVALDDTTTSITVERGHQFSLSIQATEAF